ncbi:MULTISPECIES: HNH endonuclease [Sphingobacterium]|uniref:HNH endonuclease n=1 Tax=Sphingobacterium TaxID=28453 RepID=UPI00257EFA36|nr:MULTISPECIES: HNH endonuclease [Sphingobacterium]
MLNKFVSNYKDITGKDDIYACPICLKEFPVIKGQMPAGLTKEHVPPHSLGGGVKCYTCSTCNNTFGAKADSHLLKGIQLNQKTFFLSLKEQKIRLFSQTGEMFQGHVSTNEDGTLTMHHSKKNNHPSKLETFIGTVREGSILNFIPIVPKVDLHLLNVGLLKSAYLFAFEMIGYEIAFNSNYDIVREQLLNPDDKIYFENTILRDAFIPGQEGVYFSEIGGIKFICVVLKLKYHHSEIFFGIQLPHTDSDSLLIDVISYIQSYLSFSSGFSENSISYIDRAMAKQFIEKLTSTFTKVQ